MQHFEFINFKAYPNDQYLQGIATIRFMKALVLKLKLVKTKDGNGSFFCFQNYTVTENGEKKYIPCCMFDSRAEEELMQDWLRGEVHKAQRATAVHVQQAPQEMSYSQAKSGVAADEQLPF